MNCDNLFVDRMVLGIIGVMKLDFEKVLAF